MNRSTPIHATDPPTHEDVAGSRGRRPLWDTQERHAAATAGRAALLAVIALVAALAPEGSPERDTVAAVGVCLAALALHLALWGLARGRPTRVRLAAEASLLIDAGAVLGLAMASGGAGSPALWLLPLLTVGTVLAYAPQLGAQAAALAVVVTLAVRLLDDQSALLSSEDGLRLGLVGALLVTAVAGRTLDARELALRERRLDDLQSTSAAFVASEDPEDLRARAEAAAGRLLPGWDVAVRLGGGSGEAVLTPGDRSWRADGRAHLEVSLPAASGRPPAGVIAASRALARGRGARLRGGQLTALHALASLLAEALRRAELVTRLGRLSRTDELTGLANRRGFDESLAAELARTRRSGQPLALVLLDIDHFKQLNDRHGHQAGDAVLAGLGRLLRDELRGEDRPCRFGGEEFALLLPATDEDEAVGAAERVRRAVEGASLPRPITVSLGVAIATGDMTGEALVATADSRLYRAKHAGRNRVVAGGAAAGVLPLP